MLFDKTNTIFDTDINNRWCVLVPPNDLVSVFGVDGFEKINDITIFDGLDIDYVYDYHIKHLYYIRDLTKLAEYCYTEKPYLKDLKITFCKSSRVGHMRFARIWDKPLSEYIKRNKNVVDTYSHRGNSYYRIECSSFEQTVEVYNLSKSQNKKLLFGMDEVCNWNKELNEYCLRAIGSDIIVIPKYTFQDAVFYGNNSTIPYCEFKSTREKSHVVICIADKCGKEGSSYKELYDMVLSFAAACKLRTRPRNYIVEPRITKHRFDLTVTDKDLPYIVDLINLSNLQLYYIVVYYSVYENLPKEINV